MADGKVVISTALDNKGLVSGIGSLKDVLKGIGAAVGLAFGVKALFDFGKAAIELGSNVAEVQNVVDVAFGDMAYKCEEFADTAITQFGMSELAAKKTSSTYMAMARGMGIGGDAASDMAISLTGLTGDVASFYNISQEMADVKLKSVFTGETESLKDLGVVMTQANLQAFALSQGIGKDISKMGQAEQVSLRYKYVMEQLALAQGDFARTSDSWANQTRILSMQWQEFMQVIGQALITVFTPLLKMLNSVMSTLIGMANAFNSFISALFGGAKTQIQETGAAAQQVGGAIADSVDNENALADATKKTGKAAQGAASSLDEMNVLSAGESGADATTGATTGGGLMTVPTEELADTENGFSDTFSKIMEILAPVREALAGLWEEMQRLGGFAWAGLQDFYNSFLKPVGSWVMGEGLPRFVTAIRDGMAKIDWQNINDALQRLWVALTPFAINVGEGLLWMWENVFVPFGTWAMNDVVPRFLDLLAAGADLANAAIEAAEPAMQWIWDNFLKPAAEWTGGVIVTVLDGLTNGIKGLTEVISGNMSFTDYINGLSDGEAIIMAIATAIAVVAAGLAAYNIAMAIAAVVTNATCWPILLVVAALAAVIAIIVLCIKHWDDIEAAAAACWQSIVDAWNSAGEWFNNTVVQPIADFFAGLWNGLMDGVREIGEWFTNTWKSIGDKFMNLWNKVSSFFSDIWDGIKKVFSTVTNWIKDTWSNVSAWFSNAWESMWKNVGNFFIGIWNGIVGAFESVVNWIIGGINDLLGSLNSFLEFGSGLLEKIGWDVDFNIGLIPQVHFGRVPMLAQGAVIPPNREFMAVLGDQSSGRNLEAPESLIRQIVREESGAGNNSGMLAALREQNELLRAILDKDDGITIGDETIYRAGKRAESRAGIQVSKNSAFAFSY